MKFSLFTLLAVLMATAAVCSAQKHTAEKGAVAEPEPEPSSEPKPAALGQAEPSAEPEPTADKKMNKTMHDASMHEPAHEAVQHDMQHSAGTAGGCCRTDQGSV